MAPTGTFGLEKSASRFSSLFFLPFLTRYFQFHLGPGVFTTLRRLGS